MEQIATTKLPSVLTPSPIPNPIAKTSPSPITSHTTADAPTDSESDMFRPPVNRMMRTLDRSFFQKIIPLSAATVFDKKAIGSIKNELLQSKDLIFMNRIIPVRIAREGPFENVVDHWYGSKEGNQTGRRCLLLREGIKADDTTTWSPTIQRLVEAKSVSVHPFNVLLDYDYFTYKDIVDAILPDTELDEVPVGFSQVGHVAHFNLREQYLPYKYLLGEILKDKHSNVRTVINKTDEVGSHSEFRTFGYEVLAGEDDMFVNVREQDCDFAFDYSKVYWNTRLSTEHERIVSKFKKGEAVCDVMAGVGPFSIPAGKKQVFAWANDLNPYGYQCLEHGIAKNKVAEFVQAYNMNGRDFIRYATEHLCNQYPRTVKHRIKIPKAEREDYAEIRQLKPKSFVTEYIKCPRTFDHFVMNLPATAIEFLDAFIGVYAGLQELFQPYSNRQLPLIHVYCFSTNSEDEAIEHKDICQRISERIGYTISSEDCEGGTGDQERELEIRDVRLVSPTKKMFCASFRLPAEVAFKKA
ncbi:tRNA (guanine(37)-N1)-methyltransferase [Paracoccidioides brasiliensis]|uniref:tRNA (guanine(37)-N1)-methyltransferase n=1 Tax=Paracoccidioides brasiliensis TaxID=121759 RepID=A0A1D2J4L3_PARBR|nr:tRNA (guanine(37)-N1)-methyltransferase [Paracoccidioides brasiliensis]ODH51914.1 tRNA (guanine(37)-N1)-methyltransferase [Paracoccidioides brasiliensis]